MPAVTPNQRAAINNAGRLLSAFQASEKSAQGSVLSGLLLSGHSTAADIRGSVAAAIGPEGDELIQNFVSARAALTRKLAERYSTARSELTSQLTAWLNAVAAYREGEVYTFHDMDGGTAAPVRVLGLNSVAPTETGGLWGFLRVSARHNVSDSWEFLWENGKFEVRSNDGVF